MTITEFDKLTEANKAIALWETGVKLATRFEAHCEITLYGIDGFYVELYFDETEKQFLHLHVFNTTALLQPYLETMDIQACLL